MPDAAPAAAAAARPAQGLLARIAGVVFSPYETYADVARQPRVLGVLLFVVVMSAATSAVFLSSERGRAIMFDQAVTQMESFGIQMTDEMYDQMEAGIMNQRAWVQALPQAASWPILTLVFGGILSVVFNAVLGYDSTFKHVTAVVAHSTVLAALQLLFVYPMFYLNQSMSNPTAVTVFMPFLDAQSFLGRFLGTFDVFRIWWVGNVAIGLGVLYGKRVQPIFSSLMAVYIVVALVVAIAGTILSGM